MAYDQPSKTKVFFGGWENTSSGAAWYANTTACY
jgi:hypothetical protein